MKKTKNYECDVCRKSGTEEDLNNDFVIMRGFQRTMCTEVCVECIDKILALIEELKKPK